MDYAVRVTQKENPHFAFDIGIGHVAGVIGNTAVPTGVANPSVRGGSDRSEGKSGSRDRLELSLLTKWIRPATEGCAPKLRALCNLLGFAITKMPDAGMQLSVAHRVYVCVV